MKQWIRNIWDRFVGWLYKIPFDKWLHFVAGLIIAALAAITLHIDACIVIALAAGILKETFDVLTTGKVEWQDIAATLIGGAVIQVFVLL